LLAGQVGYQLRLLARTPRALWFGVLAPAGVLALRLGRISHPGGHTTVSPAVVTLVAGLAVFGVLNTAYLTPASGLVSARQDGALRRWRLTPLPAGGYFAGRIVATVLLADAAGVVVVLLGVAMAGLQVTTGTFAALLAALTIGALAWAALGTAASIVVPTAEAMFPVLGLTYLPMILLSGVFGTIPGEPGWLTAAVHCLPAFPLIEAVSRALQPTGAGLPGTDLAGLAGWGVAGLLVSVRFFRWNPQRPARGRRPGGERSARRCDVPAWRHGQPTPLLGHRSSCHLAVRPPRRDTRAVCWVVHAQEQ
jgi:ABC-2 type transport system permease protein